MMKSLRRMLNQNPSIGFSAPSFRGIIRCFDSVRVWAYFLDFQVAFTDEPFISLCFF